MSISYPIRFADQLRQHLRALRKKRSLTQAQLGALLGVSQARIAEIEANPGLVSIDQLMQLFAALGVSVSLTELDAAAPAKEQAQPEDEHRPTKPASRKRLRQEVRSSVPDAAGADAQYTVNTPPDSKWDARLMRSGPNGPVTSILVEEQSSSDDESRKSYLEELRRLNPDKEVYPASARNYLLRPKKGSW